MTCFRLKDGSTVRSRTTPNEYARFTRLIEKGYDTEAAYAEALKGVQRPVKVVKKTPKQIRADAVEAYLQMTPQLQKYILGRIRRTHCTFAAAYQHAKDTGRAWKNSQTAEATLELLKKGYQDV